MINKMQYQLSLRQVCLFLIAFLPISKLFMMPSILAKCANEDMWISCLINLSLDFITLFFVIKTCKNTQVNVFDLLKNSLGNGKSRVVLGVFFLFFIIKSILPTFEQKDYVEYTLYTLNPTVFYFCPFFIVALFFCTKRLRIIGRVSDVLWIFTAIGLFIIFGLSINNMDLSAILPIGANGISKIAKGSISTLTWFGDSVYFFFFLGEFEFKKGAKKKIVLSFLVAALAILVFVIMFFSVFTSIAFRQKFALTEISKYATVINNIGRFDYIGIMLILFSSLFSLSLPLFFASKILDRMFNIKNKWISPIICVGINAIVLLFFNHLSFSIENFVMNICGIFFLIVGNVLPILLSFLKNKGVKNANAQG